MLENVLSIFYNFLNTSSSWSKVNSELPGRSASPSLHKMAQLSLTSSSITTNVSQRPFYFFEFFEYYIVTVETQL